VLENRYHDSTVERQKLAETPRRVFRLSKRLTAAQLVTLRELYDLYGPLLPFLFYNPWDATPVGSNYDPTGNGVVGRYTVVFRGDWQEITGLARTDVPQLQLVEVA
jgi:hypothetical protein